MNEPPRTVGQAISSTDLLTALAYAGLALVVIGSIGPWVTAPLNSTGGLDGDGKWTIVLATIGIILARRGRAGSTIRLGFDCALIFAIALYDAIHIHRQAARYLVLGVQVDHVGWGVYAVIVGAAVTFGALARGWRAERA